jgi:hypothetical protein
MYEFLALRTVGKASEFYTFADLYYPIKSQDADNGNSSLFLSGGLGGGLGLRTEISSLITLDTGIKARAFREQIVGGGGIIQTIYGLYLKVLFTF